jgi:hypothetical protein
MSRINFLCLGLLSFGQKTSSLFLLVFPSLCKLWSAFCICFKQMLAVLWFSLSRSWLLLGEWAYSCNRLCIIYISECILVHDVHTGKHIEMRITSYDGRISQHKLSGCRYWFEFWIPFYLAVHSITPNSALLQPLSQLECYCWISYNCWVSFRTLLGDHKYQTEEPSESCLKQHSNLLSFLILSCVCVCELW